MEDKQFSPTEQLCIRRLRAKCWKYYEIAERLGCDKKDVQSFCKAQKDMANTPANPIQL